MKLTNHSKTLFYNLLTSYDVPLQYAHSMADYLVFGFHPGSFFYHVLANDFTEALLHSHPGNSIEGLKNLSKWLVNEVPRGVAWGSYQVVDKWIFMSAEQRRQILESNRLIYTERDEIMLILQGV